MHGHFNLPPFGIIEKTGIKNKGKRAFAITTSGVMVKNQPVIHSSIGTMMRLAIRNHAQRIEINSNVTPGFSNSELRTQDDNVINN